MNPTSQVVLQFQRQEVRSSDDAAHVRWLCARDVGACLGMKIRATVAAAVSRLHHDQRCQIEILTPGGPQKASFVNREGVARIIMTTEGLQAEAARCAFAAAAMSGRLPDDVIAEALGAASCTPAATKRVYFARRKDTGTVKIGFSRNVGKRLLALIAIHGPLELLGTEDGTTGRETELHRRFANARTNGEWFDPATSTDLTTYLAAMSA